MIVVDTSVLIDFLRGEDLPGAARLRHLEENGIPFAVPAICCQEVLQGAKDEREWRLLSDYLGSQRLLVPAEPWATHREAARIYFDCRRQGLTVRSSVDCYIAQLALEEDGILLHNDRDYDTIQKVRSLRAIRT